MATKEVAPEDSLVRAFEKVAQNDGALDRIAAARTRCARTLTSCCRRCVASCWREAAEPP
ncbi:hypothetical protein [Sorangium sp. So ce542]|uniref:hypothetical protein n=1 Tax=Sorangium sp. So ce542 TaxID=3133316 RepID=UPI003F64126E